MIKLGKMILITGGARSGKSTYAEKLAKDFGEQVLYIATSIPFDDEMKYRIKKHREQRPAHWQTIEAYKNLDAQIESSVKGKDAVLLDCITIMITNIMLEINTDWDNITGDISSRVEDKVKHEIQSLIEAGKNIDIPLIMVTNEIGMGIVPDNAMSRLFRDIAGRMNQMLAHASDEVYLCVSGIPVRIK